MTEKKVTALTDADGNRSAMRTMCAVALGSQSA